MGLYAKLNFVNKCVPKQNLGTSINLLYPRPCLSVFICELYRSRGGTYFKSLHLHVWYFSTVDLKLTIIT